MSETDISTRAKYYERVNFTVDCIENQYDPETDELSELVFESVNNANIIMYFVYNTHILQKSDNEPSDWKHLVEKDSHWKEVIQAMAFDVFTEDIWEELYNRGY